MVRRIIFGSYDSWTTWGLTLTGFKLTEPEYKSNFVSVPGRDGDLDLSTALTDGEPRYNNRELTATFELSTGTRNTRVSTFERIVNMLDGRRMDVLLPDDSAHYVTGRLRVTVDYCDPYHGALKISGNCDPWRIAVEPNTRMLTATSSEQTAVLTNAGRRILVPKVEVAGAGASLTLAFGPNTWTLSEGTYTLPDLLLRPGDNILTYSGTGVATITWREAVL